VSNLVAWIASRSHQNQTKPNPKQIVKVVDTAKSLRAATGARAQETLAAAASPEARRVVVEGGVGDREVEVQGPKGVEAGREGYGDQNANAEERSAGEGVGGEKGGGGGEEEAARRGTGGVDGGTANP